MNTRTKWLLLVLLVLLAAGSCKRRPKKDYLGESPDDKAARMAWWKEARFGMFIHWGLYAIPAGVYRGQEIPRLGEWIMNNAEIPVNEYETLAPKFNPEAFDADAWVRLAKRSGMKYIIITSKHHDGFALWDSKVTTWDVMDRTPFKRDILKELSDACARHDIRLGFYHSIMDWHHPDAQGRFYPLYNDKERTTPTFDVYVEKYMKPQVAELVKGYGDVAVLWFDGQWIRDWNVDRGKDLYNFVRNLKPDILINNRVGKNRPDPETGETPPLIGDFGTPEQYIPPTGLPGLDWESCITMNNTWGYKSSDQEWKPAELLIRVLVDIVSKGGNLLLNVGPTAEGLIPDPSVARLERMGAWLAKNGESIYGTTASPFGATRWGRYTAKGNTVYAHVFGWPEDGKLHINEQKRPIAKIYLLADPEKKALSFQTTEQGVQVTVPTEPLDEADTVVAIELKEK